MATHGEPANVSYLSHTELRIHELTFRTSPESFVISAVIIWKSNGNLSKESLQNLGNLSRPTRALCRLRFSQYFFRSSSFSNWLFNAVNLPLFKGLKLEETEKENNAESMQKRVRREAEPTVVYVLLFSVCVLCQTAGSLSWIAKLSFLAAVLSLIILIDNNVLN